jgi:alpha-L-arabinofuranosidase
MDVKPTVDYFVQQLYGQNTGNTYIPSNVILNEKSEPVRKRISVSVVRDSKSNDIIVKMVNMLPVAVNAKINLEDVGEITPSATRTVLTGAPDDNKARPVVDNIAVSKDFPALLPQYSFTVIRVKTNTREKTPN